jgi:hypothetical protein
MSQIKNMVGQNFFTKYGLEYTILSFEYHKGTEYYFKIQFLHSKSCKVVDHRRIQKGSIKDNYHPSKYGVGYFGEGSYDSHIYNKKAYKKWDSMLSRCYNEANMGYKDYGAKGVSVCDRWLCFQNFAEDLPKLRGWNERLFTEGKLELDKDGILFGNKEYSLDKCQLVTREKNMEIANLKKQKEFIAISPKGKIYFSHNQNEFAKLFNLTARTIGKCLHHEVKKHRGWTFTYDTSLGNSNDHPAKE